MTRLKRYAEAVRAGGQDEARLLSAAKSDRLVVVHRQGPRSVVFKCPCGCGDTLMIPVDPDVKRSWYLREHENGISLLPSVWRTSGCESHFILWRNQVWWCEFRDDADSELDASWPDDLRTEWGKHRRRRAR